MTTTTSSVEPEAVWRYCHSCGQLAAMPPETDLCDGCQQDLDPRPVP